MEIGKNNEIKIKNDFGIYYIESGGNRLEYDVKKYRFVIHIKKREN